MYRINPPGRGFWYRCHGHEPENKGCGNIVQLETTDSIVVALLSMASDPWKDWKLIPGVNYDAELDEIKLKLADLPMRGLSREDEQTEREQLWAEEDRLGSLESTPDSWKEVFFCDTCGGSEYTDACEAAGHHKVTVGQHFGSLDFDGRRKMLLDHVKVYAEKPTDPRILAATAGPIVSMESHLFKLPVTWLGEADEGGEAGTSSRVVPIRPGHRTS